MGLLGELKCCGYVLHITSLSAECVPGSISENSEKAAMICNEFIYSPSLLTVYL